MQYMGDRSTTMHILNFLKPSPGGSLILNFLARSCALILNILQLSPEASLNLNFLKPSPGGSLILNFLARANSKFS